MLENSLEQSAGIGSVLTAERPTLPDYDPDSDESHIIRSTNSVGELSPIIIQAYPGLDHNAEVRAHLQLDLHRAADAMTAIEVCDDSQAVKSVVTHLVEVLRDELPTGEIDVIAADETVTAGFVAQALMKRARDIGMPEQVSMLQTEKDALQHELETQRVQTPTEQLEAREQLEALEHEVAELRRRNASLESALRSERQKVADAQLMAAQSGERTTGSVRGKGFGRRLFDTLHVKQPVYAA